MALLSDVGGQVIIVTPYAPLPPLAEQEGQLLSWRPHLLIIPHHHSTESRLRGDSQNQQSTEFKKIIDNIFTGHVETRPLRIYEIFQFWKGREHSVKILLISHFIEDKKPETNISNLLIILEYAGFMERLIKVQNRIFLQN